MVVANPESDLKLHAKALVSKILIFVRIKIKQTIENPQKLKKTQTHKNGQNPQKPSKPS